MKNLLRFLFLFTFIGLSELQSGSTPRTTQRTTTRPPVIYCYQCSYTACPRPFTSYGISRSISPNGWCAKMTNDPNDNTKPATRTIDPGACAYRGLNNCRWERVDGVNTYLCCCNRSYCNSSHLNHSSKYLLFFVIIHKIFS